MAQLDVLNLVRGIKSDSEYAEFRNLLARYFADKAQIAIDAMWDNARSTRRLLKNGVVLR